MRPLLIICAILGFLVAAVLIFGRLSGARQLELIKPYITYTKLRYLASRCDEYKELNRVWPDSMTQLQMFRADLKEASIDGFGREAMLMTYSDARGYGALISFGRDGKPGGKSEADQDIEVRFPQEANIQWNNQVGARIRKPRLRP